MERQFAAVTKMAPTSAAAEIAAEIAEAFTTRNDTLLLHQVL